MASRSGSAATARELTDQAGRRRSSRAASSGSRAMTKPEGGLGTRAAWSAIPRPLHPDRPGSSAPWREGRRPRPRLRRSPRTSRAVHWDCGGWTPSADRTGRWRGGGGRTARTRGRRTSRIRAPRQPRRWLRRRRWLARAAPSPLRSVPPRFHGWLAHRGSGAVRRGGERGWAADRGRRGSSAPPGRGGRGVRCRGRSPPRPRRHRGRRAGGSRAGPLDYRRPWAAGGRHDASPNLILIIA